MTVPRGNNGAAPAHSGALFCLHADDFMVALAVAAAKKIVDEYLASAYEPGMAAEELNRSYLLFGEDPYIVPRDAGSEFSARDYARERCGELCRACGP